MRYREKVGYIALGGLLMLVGMLAANLTPVGARLDNFGIITCEELRVVDSEGQKMVVLGHSRTGGVIELLGKDEKRLEFISMEAGDGAHIYLHSRGNSVGLQAASYFATISATYEEAPSEENRRRDSAIMRADHKGVSVWIEDKTRRRAGMYFGNDADGSQMWSWSKDGKARILK